ncbi:hypothetical protein IGW14_06850 [Streptomyces hygroscopicus subsp. hygroscopicus]|uniref:hypothetical protein n=1 Tax=Streptomyces hygroscopicus TaxID=1912 RepID=UPI001C657843|nr:hypothetical protein [Streptomyces hygroscopicus]MBW8087771.1 hypothetical protein [Streptomyces hygroscopicus subsp. hygroscopicus]
MTQATAEPYEEDPNWNGEVEDAPANVEPQNGDDVVSIPKRRGRAPLQLPAAAKRYEKAKAAVAKLTATDVTTEREKVAARIERDRERLAELDSHDDQVNAAQEELTQAEQEFNAALAAVQGK